MLTPADRIAQNLSQLSCCPQGGARVLKTGAAAEDKAQKQGKEKMLAAGNALESGTGAPGMARPAAGSLDEAESLTKAGTSAHLQQALAEDCAGAGL